MKLRRLLLVFFTLMLSGCLERVEINKLGVVAGIGIDKTETGYLVTAQILNPDAIAGKSSNALPVYSLSDEGVTIYDAFEKLDNLTTQALYLSHLDVIIIDEETAKEGVNHILDFALRNPNIRPDVVIVVAMETSSYDVLNVLTSHDNIPVDQLDTILNMIESHTSRLTNYNLYDIINSMNTPGIDSVLNTVSVKVDGESPDKEPTEEEKKEAMKKSGNTDNISEITAPVRLEMKDLAVFKADKLIGYLDTEEAQYYNILRGAKKHYVLNAKIDDEYYITLQTEEIKTKIETMLDERKVIINCKLEGVLKESTYPMDLSPEHNKETLEKYLTNDLKENLESFIKRTQEEFNADVLGIGSKSYYSDNKNWSPIQGYWDEIYPELDFEINVEVHFKSTGDLKNIR